MSKIAPSADPGGRNKAGAAELADALSGPRNPPTMPKGSARDDELDRALKETFPASDPVSVTGPDDITDPVGEVNERKTTEDTARQDRELDQRKSSAP